MQPLPSSKRVVYHGKLGFIPIDVRNADQVVAGVRFATRNSIRPTIKSTGHDFLGRSAGAGSSALWMHNLKTFSFTTYESSWYTGPAIRVGAGVEYGGLYPAASGRGYRDVGGSCPPVGVAGGFTQGGGHGPLGGAHGLAADQVLGWEVGTAAGEHLTASPTQNAELFWALSGGGAGNFAVVLSVVLSAYGDGPVAGAGFTVTNSGNSTAFWSTVNSWLQQLLVLNNIKGLTTVWALTPKFLTLEFATPPDAKTTHNLDQALAPFLDGVAELDVAFVGNYTAEVHASFAEHYKYWATQTYTSNISLGGRLIPRSLVEDVGDSLPRLVAALRSITDG